jgi:hypothetical protein
MKISPKAALAWTYKKGKHLVTPEKQKSLPSQMRRLHEWYMAVVKAEREMLLVKVKNEHCLGEYEIDVDSEELF